MTLTESTSSERVGRGKTIYYAATSLDGYLADVDDSIDWLTAVEHGDPNGRYAYAPFFAQVGAMAMGARTYEWILRNHVDKGGAWVHQVPIWVFTHRDLRIAPGADIRFVQGAVGPVHRRMATASGTKNIWIAGGGGLAADFAMAGLVDEMILSIAPVTLGAGRPLFPARATARLLDWEQSGQFLCARYAFGLDVVTRTD